MIEAGKGARLGNYIVDWVCYIIIYVVVANLVAYISLYLFNDYLILPDVFFYLGYAAYYFVFEFFAGITPGKLLTKTRVRNRFNEKPKLKAVFIRSILRILPWDSLSFLFGFTGMHDALSKTGVYVKEKPDFMQ
jgi:uncharacterized RDD family membrane protein YckC